MSPEYSQSNPVTQPSPPGGGAGAGPEADEDPMIQRARYDFMTRINARIQPKTLAADAHGFVEYFFERTVKYAIGAGVNWDLDRPKRKYALRRLGEIAEYAAFTSEDEVTCATLKAAADYFIPIWREVCPVRPFVFCEDYVEGTAPRSYDCVQQAPVPDAASSSATLDDVLERAHGHFMSQVYESIEPKKLTADALVFMECLFERTVKYAIAIRNVDWDNDGPRRRYALRRLAEIAEFAAVQSPGTQITCETCKAAADTIIPMWKRYCEERAVEPRFVFCEAYTANPCPCTIGTSSAAQRRTARASTSESE